jgi:hypothetical protein
MITRIIDKVGMFSSATCAVHCMLLPFLISILPLYGLSFIVNESFEIIMLMASITLAILSLCLGYKTHKNKKMFFLFSAGISLILLGRFAHENNWGLSSIVILFIGGLLISGSHFVNNKLCKSCNSCSMEN